MRAEDYGDAEQGRGCRCGGNNPDCSDCHPPVVASEPSQVLVDLDDTEDRR